MLKTMQEGFTLIELLIVLGGLVLASLTLPAVQSERNPNVQCEVVRPDAPPSPCVLSVGHTGGANSPR
jgi:hypothetical protein